MKKNSHAKHKSQQNKTNLQRKENLHNLIDQFTTSLSNSGTSSHAQSLINLFEFCIIPLLLLGISQQWISRRYSMTWNHLENFCKIHRLSFL